MLTCLLGNRNSRSFLSWVSQYVEMVCHSLFLQHERKKPTGQGIQGGTHADLLPSSRGQQRQQACGKNLNFETSQIKLLCAKSHGPTHFVAARCGQMDRLTFNSPPQTHRTRSCVAHLLPRIRLLPLFQRMTPDIVTFLGTEENALYSVPGQCVSIV